jgi:crossover junction endodeoxyribonuclease RuvC
MKILGVDPGSLAMGYGLIDLDKGKARALEYGVFRTSPEDCMPRRLAILYEQLTEVIARTQPTVLAIEEIFYRKNFKSAVMIGESRGVSMLAAALRGMSVQGYPPARVKQAIVGNGRAVKQQVQSMVSRVLNLKEIPDENAADALAIALCHSHSVRTHVQLH